MPAGASAAGAAAAGGLPQATLFSPQAEVSRSACRVRGTSGTESEYTRSVAACTTQPPGACGSGKRTTARLFSAGDFEITLSVESSPLFLIGSCSSIQASASAAVVSVASAQVWGGRTVHV